MDTEIVEFKTQIDTDVLNREIIITTQDEYTHFGDVLKLCKQKIKEVDEERKNYTAPLDEAKKRLMAKAHAIIDPIEEYIAKINSSMGAWYLVEEKKHAAEQKRLEEEAIKKANEEAERIAKETKTEVVVPADVVVPVVESIKTTRGSVSTNTAIKYNEYEVTDETLVPREYLILDDSKINNAINRGGIKEIHGIKIIEKVRFNSR